MTKIDTFGSKSESSLASSGSLFGPMPEDSDTQANYGLRIRVQENKANPAVSMMPMMT